MTLSAIDSVLSSMVESYNQPAIQAVVASEPGKVRKPRARKEKPIETPKPVSCGIPLPSPGTLDAASFLTALHSAGKVQKTNEAGKMVTVHDAQKERLDQRNAIAAFIGYDLRQPHGTQLDMARQKARFTLRPVKEDSKVESTLAGFVHGMPSGGSKTIQDLRSRIRVTKALIVDLEIKAEKASEAEKPGFLALASVESERVQHMRRDLKQIGG